MENQNTNQNEELTQEELEQAKQEHWNKHYNKDKNISEDEAENVELPSENKDEEDRKFAGVFNTKDDLLKGIDNLNPQLPKSVIEAMNDEALETYYVELRKEFSSRNNNQDNTDNTEEKPENITSDLWEKASEYFTENGGLSDEIYDELNRQGIPDEIIDNYIEGLEARQEKFTNEVYELAGGEEQFNEIKAWAEEYYTQEELDIISSGSEKEVLMKMKAVKAEYMEALNAGRIQPRLTGNSSNSSLSGYASQQDYMLDRMSREYKTNPRFKAKVDKKFKASNFAN